ncbi:hypothetical protein KO361_03535 [Candidatus Woesearchaeota archaeon]|nr:hypothetical protein [Candidatus Woesearchaeota archaeon]
MVRLLTKTYLLILVFAMLLISGCTKYVCYDGSVERDEDKCPLVVEPKILQRQAETAVDTYSAAYASALGSRHSRVNTYKVGGDWHSEILFTNIRTGTVNHVTFKIDGVTSSVSCFEGCDYLKKEEVVVEDINNVTGIDAGYTLY